MACQIPQWKNTSHAIIILSCVCQADFHSQLYQSKFSQSPCNQIILQLVEDEPGHMHIHICNSISFWSGSTDHLCGIYVRTMSKCFSQMTKWQQERCFPWEEEAKSWLVSMETLAASGRTAVEEKAEVQEAEILLILPHQYVSTIREPLHLR